MICPQCGYDMGNKSRCLRCGFVDKELAVVDETKKSENDRENEKSKADEHEVKIIDPCNVYLTHPYGYEDYTGGGFDSPFGSIFDELFGDPISDLLGGLFGFDMGFSRRSARARQQQEEQPQKRKRKQGPVVEIDQSEVEVLDSNGNPVNKNKTQHSAASDQENNGERKHKNPFRRKPK